MKTKKNCMPRTLFPALVLSLSPALAQAGNGPYIGLEGGPGFLVHQKFKLYDYQPGFLGANVGDGTQVSDVGFGNGYLGGLTLGYGFESGPRLELEVAHRHNKFDSIRFPDDSLSATVRGKDNGDTALANLWFDLFKSSPVHPYLGGGIGAIRFDIRNPRSDNFGGFINGAALNNAFDVVLAYQGGAGLLFDLSPHWSLSLDYRYLRSETAKFNLLQNSPSSHVETRYEAHSALLGLKYYFNSPPPPAPLPPEPVAIVEVVEQPAPPPPPPPPLPPPCQAPAPGQLISLEGCKIGDVIVLRGVNFEFDKSSLTVNAKTLLDQVAVALNQHTDIKIAIQGHTDSKGSDAYNQRLSVQRAQSVKRYLESQGVAVGRVSSAGFGESMPIADNATDEGRELNRRVELKVTEAAVGTVVSTPEVTGQ